MSLNVYQHIISDAFNNKKWNYSSENVSNEKIVFSINFTSDKYGKTKCKIYVFDSGICDIEATLPILCPSDKHKELSYYLAKYNCQKRYATLRLDIDSGEIINRYSFNFNQATTPKDFLNRFVGTKDINESELDTIIAICTEHELVKEGKRDESSEIEDIRENSAMNKSGKEKYKIRL